MLEQELVKLSGAKLLGGTLLSIGGLSAVAVGGIVAWKIWHKNTSQPVSENESTETTQECIDEAAKTLHAELQAEIDALSAEKNKLSEQVGELKTKTITTKNTASSSFEESANEDKKVPKTHFKVDMLQQLIRENLALRKAAT